MTGVAPACQAEEGSRPVGGQQGPEMRGPPHRLQAPEDGVTPLSPACLATGTRG